MPVHSQRGNQVYSSKTRLVRLQTNNQPVKRIQSTDNTNFFYAYQRICGGGGLGSISMGMGSSFGEELDEYHRLRQFSEFLNNAGNGDKEKRTRTADWVSKLATLTRSELSEREDMGVSPGYSDSIMEDLLVEGNVVVDGEGDRDRDHRTRTATSGSDSISILTVEGEGVSDSDAGRGVGQGGADAIMKDFERKLDQIAIEYRKGLEDYDYNDDLTLKLERRKARVQELEQLLKESDARGRETSEEPNRKIEKGSEKDGEIADLKKQLKEMKDLGEKLGKENQKMRQRQAEISTLLEKELTKIDQSLQSVSADIQSLKSKVKGEEAVDVSGKDASVELHRYFNKHMQDHFYTTDWTELRTGKFGYVHEGVIGRVFKSPVEGTVPLFRSWDRFGKDHVYTRTKSEFEGEISCHIFPSEGPRLRPLFLYYSKAKKDHLLTTNRSELGDGRGGYAEDGILGYIY